MEKERRAILSELQMMNTIEYRVDCQVLDMLIVAEPENKLFFFVGGGGERGEVGGQKHWVIFSGGKK